MPSMTIPLNFFNRIAFWQPAFRAREFYHKWHLDKTLVDKIIINAKLAIASFNGGEVVPLDKL